LIARTAIAGFQHETNTFATSPATYEKFVKPGSWPGLTCGEAIFDTFATNTLPIAGFIREAAKRGHALVPLGWVDGGAVRQGVLDCTSVAAQCAATECDMPGSLPRARFALWIDHARGSQAKQSRVGCAHGHGRCQLLQTAARSTITRVSVDRLLG
jgi:hypothetical protein